VLEQAKAFTIFVYGLGVTRFALTFLSLTSILEKKDQLRNMVVDSMWDTLTDVKSKKGKDATATMMNPTF
jgi:hypothetical protein